MITGEAPHRYVLGIDAGQTSTKAALAQVSTGLAIHAVDGAVDHFKHHGAAQRNADVVGRIVRELCDRAAIESHGIEAVTVGWTAVRPRTPEVTAVEAIVAELLPAARCLVLPDYVISLAGASAGTSGIVVIAGGGSIAYGAAGDGRDAVVGGMGYLLGDEGSAYDIGRRAVAAAARSSDGRDRRTALEDVIRKRFALDDVRDITRLVYSREFSRATLAALAPVVAATAETGDAVARDILADAGQELGRAAVAVAHSLNLASPAVYTAGGVFDAGELVLAPFRHTVQAAVPEATLFPATYPPMVGALLLARRAAGYPDDSGWLDAAAAGVS